MEIPQIRPGRVSTAESPLRVVAFFYNSAQGNSAIQLLTALGIPNDRSASRLPSRSSRARAWSSRSPAADEKTVAQVEAICREQGAEIHRQRRVDPTESPLPPEDE